MWKSTGGAKLEQSKRYAAIRWGRTLAHGGDEPEFDIVMLWHEETQEIWTTGRQDMGCTIEHYDLYMELPDPDDEEPELGHRVIELPRGAYNELVEHCADLSGDEAVYGAVEITYNGLRFTSQKLPRITNIDEPKAVTIQEGIVPKQRRRAFIVTVRSPAGHTDPRIYLTVAKDFNDCKDRVKRALPDWDIVGIDGGHEFDRQLGS